jgi:hypothetical protein
MNHLSMGFGLLQIALGIAAVYFFFRGCLPKKRDPQKLNAAPSFIAGQALLGVALVARLTNLLLRQPRPALEMIEVLLLFAAASVTLIMLAIHYRKSCRNLRES